MTTPTPTPPPDSGRIPWDTSEGMPPTHTQLADFIHASLGLKDRVCTPEFIEVLLEALELFDSKQLDYGPGNISEFGELGIVVRTNDKMARLKNLLFTDGQWSPNNAQNESIEDTYLDIANYGLIGLLCLRGKWPGVKSR